MTRRPRFTTEQIKKLISEVKAQPCLWNREHEDYNDIFYVGMAWKNIAKLMGLSENTVKVKWKNLRDTFNRLMNKNPNSAFKYTGEWPYFDEMLFLLTCPPKKEAHDLLDDDQDYILLSVNTEDDSSDVLPHSEEYYDLLFLESLAPYFKRLEPVRRVAMRAKIQDMLLRDIMAQNNEECEEAS